ncbi:MAG TPA: DinB family protein [Edaphobacter sp.]|nr:DinB family protein [Edaphobacter sp.]
MKHNLEQTTALLARTPPVLDALLRNLSGEWTQRNEGEGTWSASDVIGHLIHAEYADWMPRLRIILSSGANKTFAPFDRWGFVHETQSKTLEQLLDEFAEIRLKNLNELRTLNLTQKDFDLHGLHPALGSVTLGQLLATWTVHDLTHLHQITRIMAHQYREAVGPWHSHLGVLQCNGHSN